MKNILILSFFLASFMLYGNIDGQEVKKTTTKQTKSAVKQQTKFKKQTITSKQPQKSQLNKISAPVTLERLEILTDKDGNSYKIVKIGNQTWMAENLKTTHYADGTEITEGVYSYSNNVSEGHGLLYNWYTAMKRNQGVGSNTPDGNYQGVCPDGWHIPSKEEWNGLINYLGGSDVAGGKLKESGTENWMEPNTGATNESGFTAKPAGWVTKSGGKTNLGSSALFWSKSSSGGPVYGSGPKAWKMILNKDNTVAWVSSSDKYYGYSVRCVKD